MAHIVPLFAAAEKTALLTVLRRCGWSTRATAAELGVTQRGVQKMLKRWDISARELKFAAQADQAQIDMKRYQALTETANEATHYSANTYSLSTIRNGLKGT